MGSPLPTFFRPTFKFSIETTGEWETFTLPLDVSGSYNFTINWGDGTVNVITAYDDLALTHTYESVGIYTISMSGKCTILSFFGSGEVAKIKQLIEFNGDMGFTILRFSDCVNITTIPNSIKQLKSLTTAEGMFANCISLTSIPSGIFDNCVGITSFNYTFAYNPQLTSIPTDLFRYNTLATDFDGALRELGITSIPTDLFRYNTSADSFRYTFYGCLELLTISDYLFKYNTIATTFQNTFSGCEKLQFNVNIFYGAGEQSTRFLNKTVNFSYCFYRNAFSGIQGTVPDLWNCNFGTGTAWKNQCYGGAGNSLTSLSNYADIPGRLLTINVSPVTDWEKGDVITGQSSGKTCIVVAKVTATTYQVNSGIYTGWTNGEVIGVTGNADKLADQNAGAPTFTALWI